MPRFAQHNKAPMESTKAPAKAIHSTNTCKRGKCAPRGTKRFRPCMHMAKWAFTSLPGLSQDRAQLLLQHLPLCKGLLCQSGQRLSWVRWKAPEGQNTCSTRTPRNPLSSSLLSQLWTTDGFPGEAEGSRVSANVRPRMETSTRSSLSSCTHREEGCWGWTPPCSC